MINDSLTVAENSGSRAAEAALCQQRPPESLQSLTIMANGVPSLKYVKYAKWWLNVLCVIVRFWL